MHANDKGCQTPASTRSLADIFNNKKKLIWSTVSTLKLNRKSCQKRILIFLRSQFSIPCLTVKQSMLAKTFSHLLSMCQMVRSRSHESGSWQLIWWPENTWPQLTWLAPRDSWYSMSCRHWEVGLRPNWPPLAGPCCRAWWALSM